MNVVTAEEVAEIVLALPGTERGTSYRQPDFKLNKKFFIRLRLPGETDAGALVLHVDFFERDALMAMDRETFFTTDHYRNYPSVLIRLARIERDMLEDLIFTSWRARAPKKLIEAFDGAVARA